MGDLMLWAEQLTRSFAELFGDNAQTALAVLKIIGINIVLSGDNAVVIALACHGLPPRQRRMGVLLGAGAAVVLRIIFTVIIQKLLGVPWLKLIGGLLLLWIAVKLLMGDDHGGDGISSGSSLFEAVKIVAIADIVMSLDNVLAIAAAAESAPEHQRIWLVILGLAISIPLVVAGSTLIMGLLSRWPVLVWAGAALLGWVAGELIATEPVIKPYVAGWATSLGLSAKSLLRVFEIGGALIVVAIAMLLKSRQATARH
ncbi:MAG TPA: YjbE family putative metal transport protein [Hyphomicrobiaceae bacterium]|nr:YjbE family putative metal transport protein [Hyphomicrobiaceae bacterium]